MIHAGYAPDAIDELLEKTLTDPAFAVYSEDYDKKEAFASLLIRIREVDPGNATPVRGNALSEMVIRIKPRQWLGWAAVILIVVAGGLVFYLHKGDTGAKITAEKKVAKFDIAPGKTGAVLTLSSGKQVELDSTGNGSLPRQGNTRLSKQGGQLNYKTEGPTLALDEYNTLTTSRGDQYQLTLPDGTQVWLNAASSIKYPTAFNGKERRVELKGEAYFEVAKNAAMPFKVTMKDAEVEVLGTHFNINAYPDEALLKTTLLEGSVKVERLSTHDAKIIKPGEQAQLSATAALSPVHLTADIDTIQVMAWKNGFFEFDNTDLMTIMRQISRWYKVDVIFQGQPSLKKFGGHISKNLPLSEIMDLLASGGVKYTIDEKKLIIEL